jgi:1-deoxy-D-xylulose-5-phosphate synthase
MMFSATHEQHPTFIRYPRGPAEGVPIKDQPRLIEIGKAEIIQSFNNNGGHKVALFPLGNMMSLGRKVAAQLTAEGYDVAIINPRFTKPLDAGLTEFFGQAAELVVTLEDHVIAGGYGSAVLELFNEKRVGTPVIQIGWPDQFIEHASSVDDLRKKYGLTVENVVGKVRTEFGSVRRSGNLQLTDVA